MLEPPQDESESCRTRDSDPVDPSEISLIFGVLDMDIEKLRTYCSPGPGDSCLSHCFLALLCLESKIDVGSGAIL